MSYGLGKTDNEYSRLVLDVDAPKTVWMALAVSFAIRCGIDVGDVGDAVFAEWGRLHVDGIVPQKPRRDK